MLTRGHGVAGRATHSTAWEIRDTSTVTAVAHTVMTEKDML